MIAEANISLSKLIFPSFRPFHLPCCVVPGFCTSKQRS
ncbi:hypothetical protein OROHE_000955 [Orobanche hederae]